MRITSLFSLLVALFLFTACPPVKVKNKAKERLEKNNMDFDTFESYYFEGVNYKLWDAFEPEFYHAFTLSDVSERFSVKKLSLYFSIEKFSADQAYDIEYSFDEEMSPLEAVHKNYINHRTDAFYDVNKVSSKIEIPDSLGVTGFIQVLEDGEALTEETNYDVTYFIASFEKNNQYYVIQLVGPISNMGYLYDDFLNLIKSTS